MLLSCQAVKIITINTIWMELITHVSWNFTVSNLYGNELMLEIYGSRGGLISGFTGHCYGPWVRYCACIFLKPVRSHWHCYQLETSCILNVHMTLRRRPIRLLKALCTFLICVLCPEGCLENHRKIVIFRSVCDQSTNSICKITQIPGIINSRKIFR